MIELQKEIDEKAVAPRVTPADIEAMPTAKSFADLRLQRDALLQAATKTVEENLHLADGENCTLIHIKRGIEAVQKRIKEAK